MDPLVANKGGGPAETLATASAAVRAGPRVGPLVHREVRAVPVALSAHVALERLLARVDDLVADEVGALREGLLALGAAVELDPRVRALVTHQV